MASTDTALTVTQLNNYAKSILENDVRLHSVRVRGEISGFKRHTTGHLYFSLKDEGAIIRCVMFRSSAASLRFAPQDGAKVIVSGSVSLFVRDGQYQFYVNTMRQEGEGDLFLKFLELKDKLEKEGLFSRKRPIPFLPKCVGVVTSETGAALHDIVTVIRRRFPKMDLLVAPAQVQGSTAPASIIDAIRLLNENGRPDVIIVGRGGGSYEELSCFNDEGVARAIYASRIPVISAVGHEVDFTIADFAADLRAPTPSAAAELAVPEADALEADLEDKRLFMERFVKQTLSAEKNRIGMLYSSAAISKPATLIEQKRIKLTQTMESAVHAVEAAMAANYAKIDTLTEKLNALSPKAVLERGFALVQGEDGNTVLNAASLSAGNNITVNFADGSAAATVNGTELSNKS